MIFNAVLFVLGSLFDFALVVAAVLTGYYIAAMIRKEKWAGQLNGYLKAKAIAVAVWWNGYETKPPRTLGEAMICWWLDQKLEAIRRKQRPHPAVDMARAFALGRAITKEKWRPDRVLGFRTKLANLFRDQQVI